MYLHNLRNWMTVIFSKSKRKLVASSLYFTARDALIYVEFSLKGFVNRIMYLLATKNLCSFCDEKEKMKARRTSIFWVKSRQILSSSIVVLVGVSPVCHSPKSSLVLSL